MNVPDFGKMDIIRLKQYRDFHRDICKSCEIDEWRYLWSRSIVRKIEAVMWDRYGYLF